MELAIYQTTLKPSKTLIPRHWNESAKCIESENNVIKH